jgi:hypothetical protein
MNEALVKFQIDDFKLIIPIIAIVKNSNSRRASAADDEASWSSRMIHFAENMPVVAKRQATTQSLQQRFFSVSAPSRPQNVMLKSVRSPTSPRSFSQSPITQ